MVILDIHPLFLLCMILKPSSIITHQEFQRSHWYFIILKHHAVDKYKENGYWKDWQREKITLNTENYTGLYKFAKFY